MARTPNYEIKAHPQSLIGLPLYYTYPNWVRELELQELHGFKFIIGCTSHVPLAPVVVVVVVVVAALINLSSSFFLLPPWIDIC